MRPNPQVERTGQQLRCWLPSSLRSSAAAHLERWAADGLQTPFRKQNGFYVGQPQEESAMTVVDRLRYLRVVLVLAGLACLALYPLMLFWPSGWTWHVGHSDYPMMIVGIYATLGVFLILAARDPLANLSLIWFTVWSSVVHGGIMAVQAVTQPEQMGHLAGDVPALFIVAVALAILTPRSRGTDAIHHSAA